MHSISHVRDIIENGVAKIQHQKFNGSEHPFVVVPEGCRVESLKDLADKFPVRVRETVTVATVESFILYLNKFKTPDTIIFADEKGREVKAIFDYHSPDHADWCAHSLVLGFTFSPEWQTWAGMNGKKFDQTGFAEFIENNLPDIVEPSGADMLEIARKIEATRNLTFKSGVRLDNGQQQLVFDEQIEGTAANGRLEIPQTFDIGIEVFKGDTPYRVTARFRWRIKRDSKALELWYDLHRPHKIIEDAYKAAIARLEEQVSGNLIQQG